MAAPLTALICLAERAKMSLIGRGSPELPTDIQVVYPLTE